MEKPNCTLVTPQHETDIVNFHMYVARERATDYVKVLQPVSSHDLAGIYTYQIPKTCDLILEWVDTDLSAQYFFGDQFLGDCIGISRMPTLLMNNLYVKSRLPEIRIKCRLVPSKERAAFLESYRHFIDVANGLAFHEGYVTKHQPKN